MKEIIWRMGNRDWDIFGDVQNHVFQAEPHRYVKTQRPSFFARQLFAQKQKGCGKFAAVSTQVILDQYHSPSCATSSG